MSPQGIIMDGKTAPALVALSLVVLHMCTMARTPFVRCACAHTRRVGEEIMVCLLGRTLCLRLWQTGMNTSTWDIKCAFVYWHVLFVKECACLCVCVCLCVWCFLWKSYSNILLWSHCSRHRHFPFGIALPVLSWGRLVPQIKSFWCRFLFLMGQCPTVLY